MFKIVKDIQFIMRHKKVSEVALTFFITEFSVRKYFNKKVSKFQKNSSRIKSCYFLMRKLSGTSIMIAFTSNS